MKMTVRTLAGLVLVGLIAVSCSKKPPKEPQTDYDPYEEIKEKPVEKEPEPPPPPKCESLDEECKGKEDSWVAVGEVAEFQPPVDWLYAKLENMGVTLADGKAAAIAYRVADGPVNPKKDFKGAVAALQPVFEAVHAEVPESLMKKVFRKAPVVDDGGALALNTWQLERDKGLKVDGEQGVVIAVTATVGEDKVIVGAVAFKAATLKDNLEAVQKSYRTVRGAQ